MLYTAIYFAFLFTAAVALALGGRYIKLSSKVSLSSSGLILLLGFIFYFTFLDNYLTRHWGGSMTVKLPENAQLIGMTWKDSSLWYQYYLPATNECVFREHAPVGLVEGEVKTPNCNPVAVGVVK